MKDEDTKIPLITLVVLIIASFIPIVQVILLHLNGAFLFLIEFLFDISNGELLNSSNLACAIASLLGYALAKRKASKIIYVVLVFFFLSSFIAYSTENFSYERYPYFLPFMLQAILVVIPLYLIEFIKERRKRHTMN